MTERRLDKIYRVNSAILYPINFVHYFGWLGSRVVSVLDSGAEGPGSNRNRNRNQLRNATLGNRVWATFTFTSNPITLNPKSGRCPGRANVLS